MSTTVHCSFSILYYSSQHAVCILTLHLELINLQSAQHHTQWEKENSQNCILSARYESLELVSVCKDGTVEGEMVGGEGGFNIPLILHP